MDVLQILVNGLMLGALYACIAVGFSLVWGVLNVINMLHGSFIVLGGYLAFFAWRDLGLHPLISLVGIAAMLFALGWVLQYGLINHIVARPVLTTLTLTFGLDMFAGLPVLASDIPVNKEVITHLQTGYLFKKGSVQDITKSLLWYKDNVSTANEMAIRAHNHAMQNFELGMIAGKLENYLLNMIIETN